MAKHRTHSIEFKRQVVQEFLGGESPHGLAKRHGISRTHGDVNDVLAAIAELLQHLKERGVKSPQGRGGLFDGVRDFRRRRCLFAALHRRGL